VTINPLFLELDLKWSSFDKVPRIEIYNFKNEDDFKTFQANTEYNEELLNCFEDFEDLDNACTKWLKLFNDIIKKSFKKIRISNTKNSDALNQLFAKKEVIKQKIVEAENSDSLDLMMNLEKDYQDINEEIASFCSERNKDIVKEFLDKKDETEPHNQLKPGG
jgi:hypothetical protein